MHVVCVDGMPRHVRDVRIRRDAAHRGAPEDLFSDDEDLMEYPECPAAVLADHSEERPQDGPESHPHDVPAEHPRAEPVVRAEGDVAHGGGEEAPVEQLGADGDGQGRPRSVRRPPQWLSDYVT